MTEHIERQEDRREPPTPEEMLAHSRGQLSPEQAAEVWERLQQHPDLAAIYTAPFPEDGGEYVSPEQLDARWEEIRSELGIAPRKVLWFPRILSAAAAVLILALGGLLWQTQSRVRDLEARLGTPRVTDELVLPPDGHFRGSAPPSPIVRAGADAKLVIATRGDYTDYTVEIRTAGTQPGPTPVWRREGLIQSNDDELEIVLLSGTLDPGNYQLVLYGNGGKQLDTFTFTVEP